MPRKLHKMAAEGTVYINHIYPFIKKTSVTTTAMKHPHSVNQQVIYTESLYIHFKYRVEVVSCTRIEMMLHTTIPLLGDYKVKNGILHPNIPFINNIVNRLSGCICLPF